MSNPVRSAIGAAEHVESDAVSHTPMHQTRELEQAIADACAAVHRSADSLEKHIAVIEALADSLPPLTESVTRLTDELGPLLRATAPLGAAEREVSRAEGFFHRHRHEAAADAQDPPAGS